VCERAASEEKESFLHNFMFVCVNLRIQKRKILLIAQGREGKLFFGVCRKKCNFKWIWAKLIGKIKKFLDG
jgi:hypothetical protein